MNAEKNPVDVALDEPTLDDANLRLRRYCADKLYKHGVPLNAIERTYFLMASLARTIVSDGLVAVFHELLGPQSFREVCDGLAEVGGTKLHDLLREAWQIYTKGKEPISPLELREISVTRFNTRELMNRFDDIRDEIMKDIEEQYVMGKVWSIEYAKLHRHEFEPLKQ